MKNIKIYVSLTKIKSTVLNWNPEPRFYKNSVMTVKVIFIHRQIVGCGGTNVENKNFSKIKYLIMVF
jgi:hypothetical protein